MSNTNKPYILIVDDLEENLILLEESLKSFDADIIKALSGEDALLKIKKNPPAVALIDIMMPRMSGYQLAEKIRNDNNNYVFPIIFITANYKNDTDIFKGYQSGAIDYIFKPFNISVLQNKVSLFLKMDRQKQEIILNQCKIEKAKSELEKYKIKLEKQNEILKISESRFRIVSELSSDYSYEFKVSNEGVLNPVWVTDAFMSITGYTVDEVEARGGWKTIIHPEDFETTINRVTNIISGNEDVSEFRIISKNGQIRWLKDYAKPLFNANGEISGLIGTAKDITESKLSEKILQESEEKWRSLFKVLPVGVSIVNNQNICTDVNSSLSQILGLGKQDLLHGKYLNRKYLHPDKTQMLPEEFPSKRAVKEQKIIRDVEICVEKEDGTIIWTNVHAAPLSDGISSVVITNDVTGHRMAEQELKESRKKLLDAQRLAHIGNWNYNAETQQPEWSEEMIRIWGLDPEKGAPVYSEHQKYIHPDDFQQFDDAVNNALKHGKPYNMELRICRPDGNIRNIITICEPVFDDSGKVIRLIGTNQDITERKQAEEEITQTHKQLREYASRLQQIREEERTSIAREIHDEFGQVLTALKMNLTILGNEVKNPEKTLQKAEIVDEINNMNQIIDKTIHHVRVFTNKLRPDVLDNFGLIEALDTHIDEFRKLYNLKCNFLKPDEIEISSDKSIAIYRIVQEALTNVKRHANATEINISIFKKNDFLNLIIEDNGAGIDQKQSEESKKFGIIGMKERAYICDGKLEITSDPGRGTKIELTIPLIKND